MIKPPVTRINHNLRQTFSKYLRLLRHFPYTELLATFIPIYAYGITGSKITDTKSIFWLLPFVFTYAAGFIYNDFIDIHDPVRKKNPIQTGEIHWQNALVILLICCVIAILTFLLFFHSFLAICSFFIYFFLCFAYSGLKIRFKEKLVGPFIAAFIIWIGGPLVLSVEIGILDTPVIAYLSGAWLIYVGREIYHTWIDFEDDLHSGYRTFSVRLSLQHQMIVKATCSLIGILLIGYSFYIITLSDTSIAFRLLSLGLLLVCAIAELFFCFGVSLKSYPRIPYLLFRLFFILLAGAVLQLNPWVILLFAWIFVTSKRS